MITTLANFPAKSGALSDSAYIYISEGGQEKKLTVSDLLSKIGSTYSTDINSFLASLTSVAGFDSLSKKGANIASATTTNLDTATGNYINITGTTTITSITLAEGKQRLVRFAGTLILTNGASLVLPSSSNITTSVDDFAIFVGDTSGVVRCVGYFRSSPAATQAEVNAGTNNTNFVTPLTLQTSKIGFWATLTANQNIGNAIITKINLNSTSFNYGSYFNTSTGRFTPLVAGKYLIGYGAQGQDALVTAQGLIAYLYKNGGVVKEITNPYYDNGNAKLSDSIILDMNGSTDYIELYAVISGTGANTIAGGTNNTFMYATRVSA